MKKKILALALALTFVFTATGCGKEEVEAPVTSFEGEPIGGAVKEEPTEETVVEEAPEIKYIVDREVVDGKKQSYLTGEWKDVAVVDRRPMAVMIPDNKPALPQYGVSLASIIYEAPMESGSCTRLMGVFEDYDELDHIGPVRSSRLYFIYEAMSCDAIYCNWGLARAYVETTINSDAIDNISAAVAGIYNGSDEAFDRDPARKAAGYATEFTGILKISGYEAAVERQKYSKNYRDSFIQNFKFAVDDYTFEYSDYPDATTIRPNGDSSANSGYGHAQPSFVYDKTDHLYHRYQFGAPQIDEYNNKELAVTNVVFKIVQGSKLDEKGYLSLVCHGTGDGYVFTNGKVIEAAWSRGTDNNEPTYYYDKKTGEEIALNQGKTWICLIWADYADLITIE